MPGHFIAIYCACHSTTSKYLYAFLRWKSWADTHREVVVFPVRETDFALYLQHLSDTVGSKSTVEKAVNAVGWVHQLSGYPTLAESPLFGLYLMGCNVI